MEKTLSIAIPAFSHPKTELHISQLLHSISLQDCSDSINVYISYHTKSNSDYENFKLFLHEFEAKIVSFPNFNGLGNWIENTNFVLDRIPKHSFVKILFQDDILLKRDSLSKVIDESRVDNWLASGFSHFDSDYLTFLAQNQQDSNIVSMELVDAMIPKWDNRMPIELINFIGAPSVITLPPYNDQRFDKRFIFCGDVEFYYRLYLKYGQPIVVPDIDVGIRRHPDSVTSGLSRGINVRMPDGRRIRNTKDVHVREVILMKRKYGFSLSRHERRIYFLIKFVKNAARKANRYAVLLMSNRAE